MLYETDLYAWTKIQSEYLKNREFEKMDIENLIEEIDSLGRSEPHALRSHLAVLLMHLLKIKYQPEKRTRSWDLSVKNSRMEVNFVLENSPSLKHRQGELMKKAYKQAIVNAAKETGLDEDIFPKECPWSIEELFNEEK